MAGAPRLRHEGIHIPANASWDLRPGCDADLPEQALLPADFFQRRSNFSMTGVSHQAGQECDHPVERVILTVGRTSCCSRPCPRSSGDAGSLPRHPTPSRSCVHRDESYMRRLPLRLDFHGALRRAPGRFVVGQISLSHDLDDPLEHVGGRLPCHDPHLLCRVVPALVSSVREDFEDFVHSVRHANVVRGRVRPGCRHPLEARRAL